MAKFLPTQASRLPNAAAPGARVQIAAAQQQAAALLIESLLHDARNPLNALAINLDVLAEKLKAAAGGPIPPAQAKNVNAMREQIFRVDGVLKQFSDFLAPRLPRDGRVNLSELLERAVALLAYESRRVQVRLVPRIEPGLVVRAEPDGNPFVIALLAVLRGALRASSGSEVRVTLEARGGQAALGVEDGRADALEPLPDALAALELLAQVHGGGVSCGPRSCTVTMSLWEDSTSSEDSTAASERG